MQRAIDLARKAAGENEPNPMVGAVVVYEDRIIGEGWHQIYGKGHAEVNAINSIASNEMHLLSKATMFVTLEPCYHFGKTPPCVDLILKHQIPKVVIACSDPFPLVAGKSIEKLRKHDVEVSVGMLANEAMELIKIFLTNIQKQRPYIILKWAQSLDAYMGREGEQVWVSNAVAKRLVHRWRMECGAILIGTNTALTDNPTLDNRYFYGKSPLRVVLDRQLRLPKTLTIYRDKQKTLTITAQTMTSENPHHLYYTIPFEGDYFKNIFEYLYKEKKIGSILIEGGAKVLESLIQLGLWDEARVIIGNVTLDNGIKAPILNGTLLSKESLMDNELLVYRNHL